MNPSKLIQLLQKMVAPEDIPQTIRALKSDAIVWSELSRPGFLETIDQLWPMTEKPLTPANLGLFVLQPELVSSYPGSSLDVHLLEQAILAYEQYILSNEPVSDLKQATLLAIALLTKAQQTDWSSLLQEIISQKKIDSDDKFISLWGTPLSLVAGLVEDLLSFLSELVSTRKNVADWKISNYIIQSLPVDQSELVQLYKVTLDTSSLEQQLQAVQLIKAKGENELAVAVAKEFVTAHLNRDLSPVSVNELWSNSRKSFENAENNRLIAALAQIAGEPELARNFLEAATRQIAAQYAGLLIQKAGLPADSNGENENELLQFHHIIENEPEVQEQISMLDFGRDGNGANDHPISKISRAKKLSKDGNLEEIAQLLKDFDSSFQEMSNWPLIPERALNWDIHQLITSLIDLKRWTEARQVISSVLSQTTLDSQLLQQSLQVAQAMHDSGEQINALEALCLLNPDDLDMARQLALAYGDAGQWSDAFDQYQRLVESQLEARTSDLLGFAQSALKAGKIQLALETAQKVLASEPENGQAMAILGYAHFKQGDSAKALENLNRSVELCPDELDPWLLMADLYDERGDVYQSLSILKKARTTFPGELRVALTLAKKMLQLGQAADALSVLKSLPQEDNSALEVSLVTIQAQKALNLHDVEETIEKTYTLYPQEPRAIYEYAALQLEEGERRKSVDLLQSIILQPSAQNSWKLAFIDAVIGEDCRGIHQTSLPKTHQAIQARKMLDEVMASDPDNLYAILLHAEVSMKEGQAEKAFGLFSNLLKRSTTENSGWFDRIKAGFAWASTFLHKFDLALGTAQSVVETHPDWTTANQTLAEVDQATGEISDAVDQANQVLENAANLAESADWFVNFMTGLGKQDEAVSTLQKLANTMPHNLPLWVKLGEISPTGEIAQILETIKQNLVNAQNDREMVGAVRLNLQAGDKQTAKNGLKLRLANQLCNPIAASLDLAGFLRMTGQVEEGLQILQDLERQIGATQWLQLVMAETISACGNTAAALSMLNQLTENNEPVVNTDELFFIPSIWKSILLGQVSAQKFTHELAFQSGRYSEIPANAGQVESLAVEADYALGGKKQECLLENVNFASIQSDSTLAVQYGEFLLDAGKIDEAGKWLMDALDLFPQDKALKFAASRQAALSGDWSTAEALFLQELVDLPSTMKIQSSQEVCLVRNLIKTAIQLEQWPAAIQWSKRLVEDQSASLGARSLRTQTLVKTLECEMNTRGAGIRQHTITEQDKSTLESELKVLINSNTLAGVMDADRWIARANVLLDPSQNTVRRLAMIPPRPDDIAAMMLALKRTGQEMTAIQLGKKHDQSAIVLQALANCFAESDPQKGIEALDKARKLAKLSPSAASVTASLYRKLGDRYSAINALEEALEYWPDETGWHELVAEDWKSVGDLQNSTRHLEKALELEPENQADRLALGKNYLAGKNTEAAIETLLVVTQKTINNAAGWETLAEAYYQAGNIQQALEAAQRAISADEFSVTPYLLSAQINLDQNQAAKALPLAQKAVRHNERNADALIVLAKAYLANGNKLQALQTLEKVPQAKDVSIPQLVEHARLVKEINGAANAKGMLESLAERFPDHLEVLNMLAEAYLASGDHTDSMKAAQQSLKLKAEQPDMQRFLGKLQFESGNLDQAIHNYSLSIAQNPNQVETYLDLSKVYEQQRDFRAAMDTLRKALEIDEHNLSALLAAAALTKGAKDYAQAESFLRRAAEIAPNDVNIRRQLGAVIALNLVESSQEASSHI